MSVIEKNGVKAISKGFGLGGIVMGGGVNLAASLWMYKDAVNNGDSKAVAFAKASADFIGWQVAVPAMFGKLAFDMTSALGEAGVVIGKQNIDNHRNAYKANFGGSYVDTQHAATMRQQGMNNISGSRATVKSSLGGEAKQFYRRDMYWT